MKFFSLFVYLIIISVFTKAQTIKNISKSICDSISSVNYDSEEALKSAQLRIYHHEMVKYPTLLVDITEINRPHQYNEFNYKINRELLKTCPLFKDQFSLIPLSKILDVEALINEQQQDSLEIAVVDFINSKKINLVIVTIDDVYPYKNLKDFANSQSEKWKIGERYERGGIIIVLSKDLNAMSITPSQQLQQTLSESDCIEIIDSVDFPFFIDNSYFKGLLNCITALKVKL